MFSTIISLLLKAKLGNIYYFLQSIITGIHASFEVGFFFKHNAFVPQKPSHSAIPAHREADDHLEAKKEAAFPESHPSKDPD